MIYHQCKPGILGVRINTRDDWGGKGRPDLVEPAQPSLNCPALVAPALLNPPSPCRTYPAFIVTTQSSDSSRLGWIRHGWVVVGLDSPRLSSICRRWVVFAAVRFNSPLLGSTHRCWVPFAVAGFARHCWVLSLVDRGFEFLITGTGCRRAVWVVESLFPRLALSCCPHCHFRLVLSCPWCP